MMHSWSKWPLMARSNAIWSCDLQKVKDYLVGSSLVSKLQAKHDLLKEAVEKGITSAFRM